jgi:HEAT repeat protein
VDGNEHHGTRPDASTDPAGGVGVLATDSALIVRTWDRWLEGVTGIPADEARGRALEDLVPDLAERGLLAPFQQVLSRGVVEILAPAFHRYLIPCPPATASPRFDRMQQRVTIGPLREDGRIVGTIVAIEDVTARVERELELKSQLAAADPAARLRAAEALSELDPGVEHDPLLDVIGDDDWRVRRAAVRTLRRRRTADVMAATLNALRRDHRNFSVLSSAIELLAASDLDVVQPLTALLRDADRDLRVQAALVLGERGDGSAAGALMEALDDADENVRFHVIEALGKLKASAAVDALVATALSGDFFLAFPALEALARIGDPGVAPRLVPLMQDELLGATVADVLGRLGDEDVVGPLTRLLNATTTPAGVVADALVRVRQRYEDRYGTGEHVADLLRRTITPAGTQNLLDVVQHGLPTHLPSAATVLGWLEGPAVDRALTRLLGQPSVRGTVVEYLVRHGERVVDLLIEQLRAEDLEIRQAAVVALGRIGTRRATLPLLQVLGSDPRLMVLAAGALARIGDPRAFEPLLDLLGHPEAPVRQAVIAALNSIGHPAMAAHIEPLLRDARPHVRESAVRIAGYFGYRTCAEDLLACCHDRDPGVRRAAIEHLAFLDDDRAPPTLRHALTDASPLIRVAAVQALGRLDAAHVDDALAGALHDSDSWVRYFAARALGDRAHQPSVQALMALAHDDPVGHVRIAALDALGALGCADAIPALSSLAAADDPDCRNAALGALGRIREADAWPPLLSALRHDDGEARAVAASAVARYGGPLAVEALEWAAAADDDTTVVRSAVEGLVALAVDEAEGYAALQALVRLTADERRREIVVAGLASVPVKQVPALAEGLNDPRTGVRLAVVQALGRMRAPEASRSLERALADPSAQVRAAALGELRYLGTRGIDRTVVTLARSDPDAGVRRAALAFLKLAPDTGLPAVEARDGSSAGARS